MRWVALTLTVTGLASLCLSAAVHWRRSRGAERTPATRYLMGTAVWAVATLALFATSLLWSWPPWTVGAASLGALCTAAGLARVWLTLRPDP